MSKMPRAGTKEEALLIYMRSVGKMEFKDIWTWMHQDKFLNPDCKPTDVIMRLASSMLGHLNKKGLLQWTKLQGNIFWEPANGEVKVEQRVDLKQNGKPMAVLRIVVLAGRSGITTKEVMAKGIERPSTSLVHLEAMGCVRNTAVKGTGNRALWVATKVGKQQIELCVTKPKSSKARFGLRLGGNPLVALKVVLLASKAGITTEEVASKLGKRTRWKNVLCLLAQKGYIKNVAEKGIGKKARWVATKKAREEMLEPGQTIRSLKLKKAKEIKREQPPREPRQPKQPRKPRLMDEPVSTSTFESFAKQTRKRQGMVADYWIGHLERPERLPTRPVGLPKKPKKVVEPGNPSDWDELVLHLLVDWRWKITFEQLVYIAPIESPFYGYNLGNIRKNDVRKHLEGSVLRLQAEGKLMIGGTNGDRNKLSPAGLISEDDCSSVQVFSKPANKPLPRFLVKVVAKHEAWEIVEPEDWSAAVMEVLENSEGSATYVEIVQSIWQNNLTRWCLRKGTTLPEVGLNVKITIRELQDDGEVEVDSDLIEDEEVHWRVA
ncbi:MAG: hypothetical protein NT094_04310 [Candidatus Staskawiczbacteria bacterium]|nr:hypothetical protein [Candidatus Staskawiczbacteria bacterium]